MDNEAICSHLNKIYTTMCSFVPNRPDIHQVMFTDLNSELDWDIQQKLVIWAEKFQAPVYDQITSSWKRKLPEEIGVFVEKLYDHLEDIRKGVDKYKDTPLGGFEGRCK